jgi:two-component system, NarL family, nitrate/nitrite response regulator NarL
LAKGRANRQRQEKLLRVSLLACITTACSLGTIKSKGGSVVRVLIADDHDLLRDTLVLYLQSQGDFETATAANLEGACDLIDTQDHFDLIMLDLNMPGMNGLEGLRRALAMQGGQRVALLSGNASREIVAEALEAGAAGFVPKTLPARSMLNAVQFMVKGEKFAPIEYLSPAPEAAPHPLADRLTAREMQMLRRLTEGKSNKEIARDLALSEPTVKLHLKTLYRKLDANNRTQAAMIAQEAKLF